MVAPGRSERRDADGEGDRPAHVHRRESDLVAARLRVVRCDVLDRADLSQLAPARDARDLEATVLLVLLVLLARMA